MPTLLERLGVELPVVQAGMGGGLADGGLAGAVSDAGGLGTIGILDPERLGKELSRARSRTGKPLAVNLLLPFAREEHWKVAEEADVVVTFWGAPERHTQTAWIHQCGSVQEAQAARAAGADAVIAQGVEAGGHVRGSLPALELLAQTTAALPDFPVLLAGGVATREDVRAALEHGACAAVAGTRFLLSDESAAHAEYKQRLLDAEDTILTELFGLGWPAPHRVIANAATERWLGGDQQGPISRAGGSPRERAGTPRLPFALADRLASVQRAGLPLFGPSAPLRGSPERMVDAAPLYAGETVARIADVRPAGELVRALAG